MPNTIPTWHRALAGRIVAITGGASGIGRMSALMAARDGATVIALDRDAKLLRELAAEAEKASLDIRTREIEVTDAAAVKEAAGWCKANVGAADGLVCSAGTSAETPFLELSLEGWQRILDINLTGTFLVAQEFARDMVAAGKPGAIVTISSSIAFNPRPRAAAYAASKSAVVALTKTMALELAPHGIRVNNVAPGSVDTPLARRVQSEKPDAATPRTYTEIPLGRQGQPQDLASAILFLLSESSGWITGQTLHVNGGRVMA